MARYIDVETLAYVTELKSMGNGVYKDIELVYRTTIDAMPTVDVQPVVHAHWIYIKDEYTTFTHECSNCGAKRQWTIVTDMAVNGEYCGHCGAKMDEVEE